MCKTNELPCTESCQCMGDDECENPYKGEINDDDGDDDDDDDDVSEDDNEI